MTNQALTVKAISANSYQYLNKRDSGFTLIEVMIAVFVIGIMASIVIPSYRQYVISNAENEAQAKLLSLQIELERWRSSALTYRDFIPQHIEPNGDVTYHYADNKNTVINIPQNSGDNYIYRITLVDGDTSNAVRSLVSEDGADDMTGRTWKMIAVPNPTKYISQGHKIMLANTGIRCMTTDNITIKSDSCGNNSKAW